MEAIKKEGRKQGRKEEASYDKQERKIYKE